MDNTEEQWDYVCYDGKTKEVITIVQDVKVEPKFLINMNYVGIYVPHSEYAIEQIDGIYYFKNLNNIIYLDDYRGRYID